MPNTGCGGIPSWALTWSMSTTSDYQKPAPRSRRRGGTWWIECRGQALRRQQVIVRLRVAPDTRRHPLFRRMHKWRSPVVVLAVVTLALQSFAACAPDLSRIGHDPQEAPWFTGHECRGTGGAKRSRRPPWRSRWAHLGRTRLYLGTDAKVPVIYGLTFGGFGVLVLIDLGHILFTNDLHAYLANGQVLSQWPPGTAHPP